MAIDEAIFQAKRAGKVPPTLRAYRWTSPAVSLGRFQRIGEIDTDACRELGMDVVRRITGGKAAVHGWDISYSVCASCDDGFPRSVLQTYSVINRCLIEALRMVGVDAEERRDGERDKGPFCLFNASRGDIVLGEAKLVGSAQVWRGECFVQQGSIALGFDPDVHSAVFGYFFSEKGRVSIGRMGLFTKHRISLKKLKESLVRGFEKGFGIRLRPSQLSNFEVSLAGELIAKYADISWTKRC